MSRNSQIPAITTGDARLRLRPAEQDHLDRGGVGRLPDGVTVAREGGGRGRRRRHAFLTPGNQGRRLA